MIHETIESIKQKQDRVNYCKQNVNCAELLQFTPSWPSFFITKKTILIKLNSFEIGNTKFAYAN